MAKNKEQEALYKAEGLRRIKARKERRMHRFLNEGKGYPGSDRYERRVRMGLQQTCEWGSARCDIFGCNGDC